MISTVSVLDALQSANVQAFLHVIRKGEAGDKPDDYTIEYGGGHFTDQSKHPYDNIPTTEGGKACGAYQFLGTTWHGLVEQYPDDLTDFGVAAQDFGAVALINERGALQTLIEGNFDTAVEMCRKEWTSLPGASENNPHWTLELARSYYEANGGTFAGEATPAPEAQPAQGDTNMTDSTNTNTVSDPFGNVLPAVGALASAFNPLAGALISAFAPLVQSKITAAIGKHSGDPAVAAQIGATVSAAVLNTAKQLTGQTDSLQAVAQAANNPAMMDQIAQAAVDKIDEMAPLLDKIHGYSKDEWAASETSMANAQARAKDDTTDLAKPLAYAGLSLLGFLATFVCSVAGLQTWKTGSPNTEVWAALTGIIGFSTGVISTLYAYRFGTSRQSGAKDVLIGQLASK